MEFYTVTNTEFNEIDKDATRIEQLFNEIKELKLCKSIDWFGYDKCDIYVHSQCRVNPGLGKFAFAIIRQRNNRIIHEEWKKVKITKTTSREIELLSVIESLLWIPLGNKVDINVFVHSHELFTLLVNLNKLKENRWRGKNGSLLTHWKLLERLDIVIQLTGKIFWNIVLHLDYNKRMERVVMMCN